jgi:predicted MFS family arabinose efflux permease
MRVDSHSKGPFTRVTLPLAVFGLINQAARTVMAIIGPMLAVEFALSASELGLLAACMLAAYAVAQLPGGMALDRVGPRNVQGALALITAAGFALFALAESFAILALARLIVGVGISAGLMAIIKANAQWFAPAKVAFATGIAVSIGGLGGVLSTAPVAAALPTLGWRGVLWALCGLSAATALWIFVSVPDRRGGKSGGLEAELGVMGSILRSRVFWRFAPAVAMLAVLNFAYLGLWAGPWLRDVAGYDSRGSANTLLAYTLTMMVGALVVGAAASRAKSRSYPPMLVTLACTAGQIGAQIGLALRLLRRRRRGGLRHRRPDVSARADRARGCSISGRAPPRAAGIRGATRPRSRSRCCSSFSSQPGSSDPAAESQLERMREELVARIDPDAVVEPAGEAGFQLDPETVLAIRQRA